MQETLESLVALQQEIDQKIKNFSDGYFYYVIVTEDRSSECYEKNNTHTFMKLCNEYYGDNGYSHGYTNNPNFENVEYDDGCSITYINNVEDIEFPTHKKLIQQYLNH